MNNCGSKRRLQACSGKKLVSELGLMVNAAVQRITSAASSERGGTMFSDHEAKRMILNVTAALIDNGEFEGASRLLTLVEQNLDEIGKIYIH